MTARSTPYPRAGSYQLRVPANIWEQALDTIRSYGASRTTIGPKGSECLVYLAGIVANDETVVVTALYELGHEPQGGSVVVAAQEARWLLRALSNRDEKLIAQVHSHREGAGHSRGDDAHATSFHDGFISIVVPRFGKNVAGLQDCAVVEYTNGSFMELPKSEVHRRFTVQPPVVLCRPYPTSIAEGPWQRFVQKLKSIAPNKR
jgi:hypothetical protein